MQISGLCFAVAFFALMRQAYAWELDQPVPSLLSAVESNLRIPRAFFFLAILPILFAVLFSFLSSQTLPPIISFPIVSVLCYVFANGVIVLLILLSQMLFYVAATLQVAVKKWLVAPFFNVSRHVDVFSHLHANDSLFTHNHIIQSFSAIVHISFH